MNEIIGKKFNRWTVKKYSHSVTGYIAYFWCVCDCGTAKAVRRASLVSGKSASCGCLAREIQFKVHSKHGMWKSPIYQSWLQMKDRCRNKNNPHYKNYGGRGISVCERWQQFKNFHVDVGDRPSGMTIDRIDNNGNYEPKNFRWATKSEQQRNRRTNRWIEYGGEKLILSAWAEKFNMTHRTLSSRINKLNWPIEKALTLPVKHLRRDRCLSSAG